MKERLTKNLGLKLISLFCAFFVWLAVVNVANPVRTKTSEVPVEIENAGILERSNLTYEIVGKTTAVLSYQIRTKDAYKIKDSDFRAYADLSEMYGVTGAIPIKVEVLKNGELLQAPPTVKSPEVIKIRTEAIQTKRFTLHANPYGTLPEGYVSGEVSMTPDFAYVKGPTSLVGQINSVGIEFNIDGAVSDVADTAQPIFYDANGNSLDLGESVKVQGGDISYTMQVLRVKKLPLDFVVTGEVAPGYRFTGIECNVKEVPVAGLKSALAELSTFTVQSPELSIEGATKDKVREIDLSEYLQPNIQIAGMDDTMVRVTLRVEKLEERSYSVDTKNIGYTGEAENYDYSMKSGTAEIKVRGLKEDLDSLSADKMKVTVDVSGLTPGIHNLAASLQLDEAYEVTGYPLCEVTVSEKAEEESKALNSSQAESEDSSAEQAAGHKQESGADTENESKADKKTDNKTTAGAEEEKSL